MYVAVRKVGNQWFREDNGALIGSECSNIDSFYRNHNFIVKTDDGRYLQTFLGYMDKLNQFIPLCRGTCVASNCSMHNTEICLYAHKTEPTKGYYVILSD